MAQQFPLPNQEIDGTPPHLMDRYDYESNQNGKTPLMKIVPLKMPMKMRIMMMKHLLWLPEKKDTQSLNLMKMIVREVTKQLI